VNLIVETEIEVEKDLGRAVSLANGVKGKEPDELETNPFRTVASFTEYVESQLSSRS